MGQWHPACKCVGPAVGTLQLDHTLFGSFGPTEDERIWTPDVQNHEKHSGAPQEKVSSGRQPASAFRSQPGADRVWPAGRSDLHRASEEACTAFVVRDAPGMTRLLVRLEIEMIKVGLKESSGAKGPYEPGNCSVVPPV